MPIIPLSKLIEYKLICGLYDYDRLCDFGDVQKLIKLNNLTKNFSILFRDDIKEKYLEIWNQTTNKKRSSKWKRKKKKKSVGLMVVCYI